MVLTPHIPCNLQLGIEKPEEKNSLRILKAKSQGSVQDLQSQSAKIVSSSKAKQGQNREGIRALSRELCPFLISK